MSKKALNFDLNDSSLRKKYPSNNYKKAWYDIRYFLENMDLNIDNILVMFQRVIYLC